jgi:hypothetical protein
LFFFNGGTGDYYLDPITIEAREEEIIYLYRKIKGYDLYEKIRFKSDDFIGSFQVYRIDKHPESYKDFAGNLIASIESDFDLSTPQGASSAALQDKIIPNKKYWYCSSKVFQV